MMMMTMVIIMMIIMMMMIMMMIVTMKMMMVEEFEEINIIPFKGGDGKHKLITIIKIMIMKYPVL